MIFDNWRLSEVINFLPDATFVIDRAGKVIAWNKAIEALTGVQAADLLGKADREYALPFYGRRIPLLIDLALSPQDVPSHQYTQLERQADTLVAETYTPYLKGGTYLWAKASPLYDGVGSIIGAIETIRDITQQRQTEKALLDHLHFLQAVIDAIPMAIFYKNPQGAYLGCNASFERCFGLDKEQIIGKTVDEFNPPAMAEIYQRADRELFDRPGIQTYESQVVYADGNKHDVVFNKATFQSADGSLGGLVGTILNISKLKQIEHALRESEAKLRFLSNKLLEAHEKERRRLSMELHDELGQTLNVLKLQIHYIIKKLRRDQHDLRVDCEYLLKYMDEVIESVRRICWDLSPSILEDLGLTVALRRLVTEFCRHYNVECRSHIPNIDCLFTPESQILAFRIFQESLNNIAKHAGASRVDLAINVRDEAVTFTIADNGKGFQVDDVLALHPAQRGLGLAAMDERVRMLGGALDISSQEGAGTKISFALKAVRQKPAAN